MKKTKPKSTAVAFRLMSMNFAIVWASSAPPRAMLPALLEKCSEEDRRKFTLDCASRRDKTVNYLKELGIWRFLTPREHAVMESTLLSMTNQQQVDASWAVEAAQALMWSLGMVPDLPAMGTLANPEILKRVPATDLDAFARSATLRPEAEIKHARGVAEFWHWRSRTRELIERGDPFPETPQSKAAGLHSFEDIIRFSAGRGSANGDLPPCVNGDFAVKGKAYRDLNSDEWSRVRSQSIERHRALNWLCGYAKGNRWEETPTDT